MKRRNCLPLETICDILSFLPAENILAFNWACLRLFRASQILYRPLQRLYQERIIKNLRITTAIDYDKYVSIKSHNQLSGSAQFQFRLVENGDLYVRKYQFECVPNDHQKYINCNEFAKSIASPQLQMDNCQILRAQRLYSDRCWPNGRSLFGLPSVGPPSDVVAIERIDLDLARDERLKVCQQRCLNDEQFCVCLMNMVSKMVTQQLAFIIQ